MHILTAGEMAEADRRTVDNFHISIETLMENAGSAVGRFCLRHYPRARRVAVVCGKGNNGGDGMVAARVLSQAGLLVEVYLLGREDEVKGAAAMALAKLHADSPGIPVLPLLDEDSVANLEQPLRSSDLILDAVVGTGFRAPLRGIAESLRIILDRVEAPIVAIDLPSGWDADSIEQTADAAYRADAVVTFTAPKSAHVFGHLTRGTFGPVVVADIGSPAEAIVSAGGLRWAGSSKALAEVPRDVNSNKGKFGHVLIVGGSYGTAGAPSMASLAALRTGAGLVTAAVPEGIVPMVANVAPELMLSPLMDGPEGAVSLASLAPDKLQPVLKRITVVALGPGLSTRGEASQFARELVAHTRLPMVLDADALNAFEGRAGLLDGDGRVLVLTPHPGEMARLAGLTIKQVEADRVGLARQFATGHKLTLVLKGWRTLIAHPDGSVAVNTTGNPAMAKGGSGDILTGIVAAMLAQFPHDVVRAVEAAVYLHGLAADCAVAGSAGTHASDEHTLLPTDTLSHLSDAFRYRVKDADGLTWICGMHP